MQVLQIVKKADLRVHLALLFISGIAVFVCRSEASFAGLLLLALLWLGLQGEWKKVFSTGILYLLVSGFLTITMGIRQLEAIRILFQIFRNIIIPVAFAGAVMELPAGSIISVFSRMRLPKALSISTVVFMRFFPTIGHEYRAIRNSLKFRGIGVSFWNVLAHLPSTYELILVPLLIRTTRIAEELAAAAIVRGVRLDNRIVSFEPVRFTRGDAVLAAVFAVLFLLICLLDRMLFSGVMV